jgi:hypothetical protein
MTEKEWRESTDIEQMLECLVEQQFPDAEPCDWKRGERKKRLFVRACLNRIWHLLPVEFKAVCEMLDPEVDRNSSKEKREALWSAAEGISDELDNLLFALGYDDIGLLCYIAAGMVAGDATEERVSHQDKESRRQQEHREQASLLRDIFGNPFRPVAVDPAWLSSAVIELASAIHGSRTFDELPILADALLDAGCDDEELLDHCRNKGQHVIGCWAVDLILGRP